MKGFFIFLLLYLNVTYLFSQVIFSGRITDKETNKELQGVSIYVNNSSIGGSSNANGDFRLVLPEKGNYGLVFSLLGYAVSMKNVMLENSTTVQIQLEPKRIEIEEVTLVPYLKDGWAIWGRFFLDNFIGTSEFSKKTKLKNHKVLKFRYNKTDKILTVHADEPLQLVNNALGYTIVYDLQEFYMNFDSRKLYFEGFTFFKSFVKETKTILQNREKAYSSSTMKFIRSTYNSQWEADGFVVKQFFKMPNVQREYAAAALKKHTTILMTNFNGNWDLYFKTLPISTVDTINSYRSYMNQPKIITSLGKRLFEKDIVFQHEGAKYLKFTDYIFIQNKGIIYEDAYYVFNNHGPEASVLGIIDDQAIEMDMYGNYYPASGMLLEDYWSWYSKLATLLPLDYGIK